MAEELPVRFGEVSADLDTFEMMELKVLGSLSQEETPGPMSSVLKLRASRLKQIVAELGIEVLGPESLRWAANTARAGEDHRASPALL